MRGQAHGVTNSWPLSTGGHNRGFAALRLYYNLKRVFGGGCDLG